jgi:hypothetical protein
VRHVKGIVVVLVLILALATPGLGLGATAAAAPGATAVWSPLPGLVGAAAPTVSGFSPTVGPVGATIAVSGTNFVDVVQVTFAGTPAVWALYGSTSLTAVVPAGATTGKIGVTTAAGSAQSTDSFVVEVVGPPTISGFAPTSGRTGTDVTITGTNLLAATAVRFGGTSAAFSVGSSTSITATVPGGASTGPISVTTPTGTADSTGSFTLLAPSITSVSPSGGKVGAAVLIQGAGFLGATNVSFGGVSQTGFTVNGDGTEISTTVPAGALTGNVTVTASGLTGTSPSAFTVQPAITGFSPGMGPAGTVVTITGTSFTGATSVTFGGAPAASLTVTASQITATVPAAAVTGPIVVTTPGGTATSSTDFVVGSVPTPTVTGFTPASGPPGTSVTVTGTNLAGATAVAFNGIGATISSTTATSVTVTVPAAATTGKITVTTAGGTATSASGFTVPAPTISSFTPSSGPVGSSVTITGTGFLASPKTVAFHGTDAGTPTSVTNTSMTVTVPAGATNGTITVTAPSGTGTSATSFTVTGGPSITSFSPSGGAVGTTVSIYGAGFTGATAVRFHGTASAFDVVDDDEIEATVPAGATTGQITVVTPAGSATSASSFTVGAAPVISSVSPSTIPAYTAAPQRLYVAGSGFESGLAEVYWNDTLLLSPASPPAGPAPNPTAQLYVTLPVAQMAVVSSGTIKVRNPGTGLWSNSYTVTIVGPTISSITPATAANTVTAQLVELVGTSLNLAASPGILLKGIAGTPTAGVTVTATNVSLLLGSQTRMTGTINLATAGPGGSPAPAGSYDVSLTYVQEGAKSITLASAFTVTGASLASIEPVTATNGATAFALTLKGAGFKTLITPVVTLKGPGTTGTTVVTGTGLTTNTDGTSMTAVFNLTSPTVVATGLYDVILTYGTGTTLRLAQALTVTNAVPQVTLLDPGTVWAGSVKPTTLTVTGSGFVPMPALLGATGSVVRVGTRVTTNTTVVGATQLTVPLLASDIAAAGAVPISVSNPAPGGGTSNVVNLAVNSETTLPTSTIMGADLKWHRTAVTLTVNAFDAESGVQFTQYMMPGVQAWTTMIGNAIVVPAPADHSNDGARLVQVQAVDWCNKIQSQPTNATVYIDTRGPTTSAGVSPSAVTKGKKLKLLYTPKDALSQTCAVTLKITNSSGSTVKSVSLGQKRSNTQGSYTFTCNFKKGKYRYTVYATDLAGNKQTSAGSKTFSVK